MSATEYQPISWSQEPIRKDKLNVMTSNDQWLFENMPTIYYNVAGIKKSTGVKIMTGFGKISPTSTASGRTTVTFGSFFTEGCTPVVVVSPQSRTQTRVYAVTTGIDTEFPDHRGVVIILNVDELNASYNKVKATIWVPFVAIGY